MSCLRLKTQLWCCPGNCTVHLKRASYVICHGGEGLSEGWKHVGGRESEGC